MTGTIADALREAAARLVATSDTARLDAELLMAHALGVSRSELLLRHGQAAVPAGFAALIERRSAREPVAYILGRQEFYGREFLVSPEVLIPRADSESTVEAALAARPDPRHVLDCGTGSGALLLTILAERPHAKGIGIDCSAGALEIASRNAERRGLAERAQMLRADWSQPNWSAALGRFDLVIANPPYVEDDAALEPDVRLFEPWGALFAGADGLDDYRVLIPRFPQLLARRGVAVVEIGHTQSQAVSQIAAEHGFTAHAHLDLAGRPRALVLR